MRALTALQYWFHGHPALGAALSSPQLWAVEAPEGTALPYATVAVVSSVREYTTGTWIDTTNVQLSLHAETDEGAASLATLYAESFNRAALSDGITTCMVCELVGDNFDKGLEKGPQGEDCWMRILEYRIQFSGRYPNT